MSPCPSPIPKEFRDDVVRVARNREPGVTLEQIAADFGVHPMTLSKWMRQADVEDGAKPGVDPDESAELREPRSADPAAGAGERGPAPGGGVSVAGEPAGKRLYPLVSELAADGIPVAVTCRVLKLARQPYYRWLASPVTDAELDRGLPGQRAVRRPPRRPGVRLPVPRRRGPRRRRSAMASGPRGGSARTTAGGARSARSDAARTARARAAGARRSASGGDFTADRPEPAVADRHHRTPHRRGQALPLRDQGRVLQPDRRLLHRLADEVPPGRRPPSNNAVARRGDVAGCVVHTDRGSQFRSRKFVRALDRHGMVGSMGRVGAAGDNAAMESFFSLLQKNVLDRRTLGHPRRTPHRDRHLDRTDLPPPPTTTRPRPVDPHRIRDHHDPTQHSLRDPTVT